MGSGRRMCPTLLWLLAFLAYSSLTSLAAGSPMEVMSAPNLLRVGTAENIFVEIQDCTDVNDISVPIKVLNNPTKNLLASTVVTLTKAKNFQDFGQITMQPEDFKMGRNIKQYVYLQAQFPGRLLEKVVLVSFQTGHIFIQTDKTIYTPGSLVSYRMFAVMPDMKAVASRTSTDTRAAVEIVSPDGMILHQRIVSLTSEIYSGAYRLSETDITGLWKVVAKFHNTQQSFTAEFEVKHGVLPSFEVKLTSLSPFFYVDSQNLDVKIKATYLFGEEVTGTAYVVFGVMQHDQKESFPSSIQKVEIQRGSGVVTLKRDHITESFNILSLLGSSIYVSVSVLTESGSEMVEAELRGIKIVKSPYTISFEKTSRYFRPGMSFDVLVEVMNPDGTPAGGVAVLVNPGQVSGVTAANGMARLWVNTAAGNQRQSIIARTNDPRVLPDRQASATMVALPYITASNNYIHIVVDTTEVSLREYLRVNLFLSQQEGRVDITYLILSRGQLVQYYRYQVNRQTLISLNVLVTKDMLPSFRIIAYYHTNANEVVADSVRLDVKISCMGSLKLEPTLPARSFVPGSRFDLKVTGDPGAKVGLVAVDKGVYVLNNKHRLTQKKVWDIIDMFDTGCTPGGGKDSMSVFYDAGLLFESSVSGTPYRQDLRCPASSRRKRAVAEMEVETSLSEEDDINSIVTRTIFPESWLWTVIHLPPCSGQNPDCETTSIEKMERLKDSITTWQFTGISLSRTHGICVSDPLEVIVWKKFFIDLRLPYSAVRGERMEIKAILHNYGTEPYIVHVYLTEEEHVCSSASKRGSYRQEVTILPRTRRSVPFFIVPMREGTYPIEVIATVKGLSLSDRIRKMLRVVPQGVLTKSLKVLLLDPAKKGVGGKQDQIINSEIPLKYLVPGTPASTQIYMEGIEPSVLSENPISGNFMGMLIKGPSGSGEGNMMKMTLPVTAAMYLDKTNQWDTVGFEKRNEALQHIMTGYQNELQFRKPDGSFALFPNSQSNNWLTAYVAKVFFIAKSLVIVHTQHICDAVKFLIINAQHPDGMFQQVQQMHYKAIAGDVEGTDSDASMTAFCLIAMQESRSICSAIVSSLPGSIDKAVAYLERRLPRLTNPYAVAMTSYALANENKLNKEILYKFASPELGHWPVPKGHVYTMETTAYALLALVKAKAFEEAKPVVRWLKQQHRVDGGYGSTQATIMVYQAVAEYWASAPEPEYSLDVDLKSPYWKNAKHYVFKWDSPFTSPTRTFKFNDINSNVSVTATGNGEARLTMVSLYYALPKEEESNCQKFNLSVELIPENVDESERVYKLRINILYQDRDHDSTMSILDIGLMTGFTANTNDLDLLSKGRARTISKYEMNTVLSERGSLIIYLEKVSHTRPEEISFRIHQKLKTGVLQPAAVSVYEYYDQTPCVKFYQPEKGSGRLLTHCINDECICAGESCGTLRKNTDNNERIEKICESTQTNEINFVYKVRVENFTESLSMDLYTVRILDAVKENAYSGLLGEVCTFSSLPHCRAALDLRTGKTYLVMGASKDFLRDIKSQSYRYALTERTWIEHWPTLDECQTEEHRNVCLGMEEMVQHYQIFGCEL